MKELTAIVAFILFMSSSESVKSQTRRERASEFIVQEGQELPHFEYVTLDGDTADTDYIKGQVTIIQFAASWCPFSQAQLIEHDKRIWRKYGRNTNFSMIGICEDAPESRGEFMRQRKSRAIEIPFAFDTDEKIYRLFVTPNGSVTRTILVDADGIIVGLYDTHTRKNARHIRRGVKCLLRHVQKTETAASKKK